MKNSYPFELPSLPYQYNALLPYIDEETMHVHHDALFIGYVNRLNNALKPYPAYHSWSLEKLITNAYQLPVNIRTTVFHNAGGVYNHTAYFAAMTPERQRPSRYVKNILEASFGSYRKFTEEMTAAGLGVFGSGWAWMVQDTDHLLKIIQTKNQDTPLPMGWKPILPLDVWEHAYFLQYLNMRKTYIEGWLSLIDWKYVEKRLRDKK